MMPGDDLDVLGRLEELVRDVPLPGTPVADDVRRGRSRQRRRQAAIAVAAAAAVVVTASAVAVVTGRSGGVSPAPAPTSPTSTSTSTPARAAVDLGDLTRTQQDRLFTRTLDDVATVLHEDLDSGGARVGATIGVTDVLGAKDTVECYCPQRWDRAPWSSADLLSARYRWHGADGSAGVIEVTIGDRSTLPCVPLEGGAPQWGWHCHAVPDPDADLALVGTCDSSADPSGSGCGTDEGRLPTSYFSRGRFLGASAQRPDGLVTTVVLAIAGSPPGAPDEALVAVAADPRITLPWKLPRSDPWMPPPLVTEAGMRAAATRTFVGPDQEWHEDGYVYDHGSHVGSLRAWVEPVTPSGSAIGAGGDADCYHRLYSRCATRDVEGKEVIVHWERGGGIDVIHLGPRYDVEVAVSGAVPGFDVDTAARFVTMDRWQPDWE